MRSLFLCAVLCRAVPAAAAQVREVAAPSATRAGAVVAAPPALGAILGIGAPAPGLAPDLRLPAAGVALPGLSGRATVAAARAAAEPAAASAADEQAVSEPGAFAQALTLTRGESLPPAGALEAARLDSFYTGSRALSGQTAVAASERAASPSLSKASRARYAAAALLAVAPPTLLLPSGSPKWAEAAAQSLWPWAQAQPLLASLAVGFLLASGLYSVGWATSWLGKKGKSGVSVLGIVAAVGSVVAVLVSGLSLGQPLAMLAAVAMLAVYFTGATKVTAASPAYFVPGIVGAALVHLGFLLGFPHTTLLFLAGGLAMWSYTLTRQRAAYWAKTTMGALLGGGAMLAFAYADRFVHTDLSQRGYLAAAWAGTMLVLGLFTALVSEHRKKPQE